MAVRMLKFTSWQFPPGAPPHLSLVIWNRPCSPPPPTAEGLQVDSCIANEAITARRKWEGRQADLTKARSGEKTH